MTATNVALILSPYGRWPLRHAGAHRRLGLSLGAQNTPEGPANAITALLVLGCVGSPETGHPERVAPRRHPHQPAPQFHPCIRSG